MRKKIFTFLLALTASIGMMWAETVVINKSEFTPSGVTKGGVTLAPSNGSMTSSDPVAMDGSFEFSTSLGKFTGITIETDINIMQIYEDATSAGWPTGQNLGTSAVWTGESETVLISCMVAGDNITITCTIEPAPTGCLYMEIDGTAGTLKWGDPGSNAPYISTGEWLNSSVQNLVSVTIDESCQNHTFTTLRDLFANSPLLTTINNIENLATANVTNMRGMFAGCEALTSLDLSSFNTAQVTNMEVMFHHCTALQTLNISSFNTAQVTNMGAMFGECYNLTNIYVGENWSTAAVTISIFMFSNCSHLPNFDSSLDDEHQDASKAHTNPGGYLSNAPTPAPTNPIVKLSTNFSGEWAYTDAFTDNSDGTATLSVTTLTADEWFDFHVIEGESFFSDRGDFSRENPSRVITDTQDESMFFQADVAGTYTFTWAYESNTLTIGYPAVAPTPTTEEVVTNPDPENPSYHYSTFFHSTQNFALTNDGTAAFVADLSGNDLVLTKIAEGTQVIPANTAVILRKSGSADPVVLTPTEENGVSFSANNDLEGVDAETAAPANCYVLSGTDQYGVGFYRINSENLKAHKAYVIYTGSAAPKRMRFVFNQEQVVTGIDNANADIKAEKRIENGQLIIIRDGVRYNVFGAKIQ